ncbi:hypothetical protein [[Eubacterium] cellulosolvens]
MNYLFCAFALFLLIFSTGSNIETIELINNGDFEGSAEKWREQIESWESHTGKEAAVSDQYSHSGRFSLRTSNGSIWQIIEDEPVSSLTLSFWIYPQSVPGFPKGRTISAIDFWVETSSDKKGISYYISGDEQYERDDIKDLVINDIERDKWNYIVKDIEEDFRENYPDFDLNDVREINVTLWAFKSPEPIIFWDDISLERNLEPDKPMPWEAETTSPTATLTSPTPDISVESTPTSSQNSDDKLGMSQFIFIIIGVVALIVIAMFIVRRNSSIRRKNEK